MTTNVKITGLKQLRDRLTGLQQIEANKIFRDNELRKTIGKIITDDIKSTSFGSPKESTLRWRELYQKYNPLDASYRLTNINMTFTGELMADLEKNIIASPTRNSFIISHSDGLHKKYSGQNGKIGKNSLYKDIMKGLQSLGYDYMKLSSSAKEKITVAVREKLLQLLT